jgi:hypothetical protein
LFKPPTPPSSHIDVLVAEVLEAKIVLAEVLGLESEFLEPEIVVVEVQFLSK